MIFSFKIINTILELGLFKIISSQQWELLHVKKQKIKLYLEGHQNQWTVSKQWSQERVENFLLKDFVDFEFVNLPKYHV